MSELVLDRCIFGNALRVLRTLPNDTFHACITSPPYWGLRKYCDHKAQIGLEESPKAYVRKLVRVFREVRRVLRPEGVLCLNLGDSYAARGHGGGGRFMDERGEKAWHVQAALKGFRKAPAGMKNKDLVGIPWMVAFALRDDGWWLRHEVIWHKANPQPESVKDRPTKAHEQVFLMSRSDHPDYLDPNAGQEKLFLLAKSERYWYDAAAIAEPLEHPADATAEDAARAFSRKRAAAPLARQPEAVLDRPAPTHRNARDVWTIASEPYEGGHFAVFPRELARRCIVVTCPEGGIVLDPFLGSGTVGQVAQAQGRRWLGIEINRANEPLIKQRTKQTGFVFGEPA